MLADALGTMFIEKLVGVADAFVTGNAGTVNDKIVAIYRGVIDKIDKEFGRATDLLAEVKGIGQKFLDDVKGTVGGLLGQLIGLVSKTIPAMLVKWLGGLTGLGLLPKLCDLLFGIAGLCGELKGLIDVLAEALIDLANGGQNVAGRIAARVQAALPKLVGALMSFLIPLLGLRPLVNSIKKLVSTVAKAIGRFIKAALKKLFALIKRIFGIKDGGPGPEDDGECKPGTKKRSPAGQSGALGPNASLSGGDQAHRIGGGAASNLTLKPGEKKLDPPGISVHCH